MRNIVSGGKCPDGVSNLFINDDPTGRLGINLTDQHTNDIYCRKDPIGQCSMIILSSIPSRKQNCFAKSWYDINSFIEYSQNLDKVFCFACSLLGSQIDCSEDMWQSEGGIR